MTSRGRPAAHRNSVGFDNVPTRPPALTALLFVVVVATSTSIAIGFKESALWVVHHLGGSRDETRSAAHLPGLVTFGLVTASTLLATALGRHAARRWPGRCGLEAIVASARGEPGSISLPATLTRTAATWLGVVGLSPIGRESALLESGGAIGMSVARRFGGQGAAMATAGMAAAFAAAYHAPVAAVLYLEEHFAIRASRRAMTFTVGGALGGHILATRLFGGHALLPVRPGPWRTMVLAGIVAVIPSVIAARLFRIGRTRAAINNYRDPSWLRPLVCACATGAIVVVAPLVSGNGMDALRRVPIGVGVGVAFALTLSVAKAAGVASAFGAGAPGGALTPTMTVTVGAALLAVTALHGLGAAPLYVPGVVALAASAGIAVGLNSPLTAVVFVPELSGHLTLLPYTAAMVAVAVLGERALDAAARRFGRKPPTGLTDEDG